MYFKTRVYVCVCVCACVCVRVRERERDRKNKLRKIGNVNPVIAFAALRMRSKKIGTFLTNRFGGQCHLLL